MRPTVAVVPWAPRVDELAQQGIGDLLADEVIRSLSHSAELYVVSRLSTAVFRQRRDALGDIRRLLGAGYVVTGNYHATGRQLRVSVEVTETATARVVYADSLQGGTAGLLSGQSSLVARIVHEVSGSILRRQLELARSVPLASLEGYTLLLAAVSLALALRLATTFPLCVAAAAAPCGACAATLVCPSAPIASESAAALTNSGAVRRR